MMVAAARRRELAIEFLLLRRRQQRSNVIVGLEDQLFVLAGEILVELLHFDVRIAHQILNLMALFGVQAEVAIEPVNEIMPPRNPQHVVTIGHSGACESDQNAGDYRQRNCAPFQAIAQDRYWLLGSPRSPAPRIAGADGSPRSASRSVFPPRSMLRKRR